MIFATTIAGIPCQIKVTSYEVQKPIPNADSDWDHQGYYEMDFQVLDRGGYSASWLEAKMSEDDRHRIEEEALKRMSSHDEY